MQFSILLLFIILSLLSPSCITSFLHLIQNHNLHQCSSIHERNKISVHPRNILCVSSSSSNTNSQSDNNNINNDDTSNVSIYPSMDDDDGDGEDNKSCPFSMYFPRYEIPLSSPTKHQKKQTIFTKWTNNISYPLKKSWVEHKYSNTQSSVTDIEWIDCTLKEKEYQGIYASLQFWKYIVDVSLKAQEQQLGGSSVLILYGLEDRNMYKNLHAIFQWWEEQEEYKSNPNPQVHVEFIERNELCMFEITTTIQKNRDDTNTTPPPPAEESKKQPIEEAAEKRVKSWVKRILVDLGICPFTKSTNKSGQGLIDVDVPVGKIWYCYSHAQRYDIPLFMYDTWASLSNMYKAGPCGKEGISSILLSVPSYDTNFPYWSGPIFTLLQSSVIAAQATHIFGIVCFHPQYATPDGTSWPGFGHMHSVPRLRSWLEKESDDVAGMLSNEAIAAGGAWQRRTPHAIVNVLRADQLEKAEKKRNSRNLYVRNINVLVGKGNSDGATTANGIGNDLLSDYLAQEKQL